MIKNRGNPRPCQKDRARLGRANRYALGLLASEAAARVDLASANGGNRHGGSRIEEVTGNEVIQSPLSLHPIALDQMKAMGYPTNRDQKADGSVGGQWGDSELIAIDPKTGERLGGHDMRRIFGKAEGY